MRIIYSTRNNEIISAVPDHQWFMFVNTSKHFAVLSIDEVDPENKDVCIDLVNSQGRVNSDGLSKYYVLNDELYVRDDWEESDPGVI